MTTEQITTVAEVETLAAKMGIAFEASDYAEAYRAADQQRQYVESQQAAEARKRGGWVDRWNVFFPRFLKALIGIGDVAAVFVQTTIIGPGVLIVLAMLLIVEQARVYHGVQLFEVYEALAAFSAWALVILNLALELLVAYVEHKTGWIEPPRYRYSLRILAQRFAYWTGRATDWQPAPKSPAIRFRAVLRLVTFSILALALAGSMRSVIEKAQGNWLTALAYVITESSLIELFTWSGGLLFALAAVLSAQALSHYAAQKAIEIGAILASQTEDKTSAALQAAGMTAAAYLLARLKARQKALRASAALAAELPSNEHVARIPGTTGTGNATSVSVNTESPSGTGISPATRRAIAWLAEHPEGFQMSVRAAAELAGMSSSTMQRARTLLKQQETQSPERPE